MAKRTKRKSKTILRLPDLEQSKSAVLNSLPSLSSRRSYDHAIRDCIDWYCSEPRLAFNRTVVTRYRIVLQQRRYAHWGNKQSHHRPSREYRRRNWCAARYEPATPGRIPVGFALPKSRVTPNLDSCFRRDRPGFRLACQQTVSQKH